MADDQFQYVKLPDGSYGKFAANATDEQIRGQVSKDFPDAFKPAAPPDDRNSIQKSFDTNTQDNPNEGMVETGLKHVVGAVGAPFVHPLNTLKSLVSPENLFPIPTAKHVSDLESSPKPQGSISHQIAGTAGDLIGGLALGGAVGGAVGAAKGFTPPESGLSPIERSAVKITKAVNPAQPAWNNYIESAQAQTGNVLDYAKRSGISISDARDFAKAAKGAAEEARTHYTSKFLDPNSDQQVSVAGTGYQGKTIGEGQRATLGDVSSRIDSINRDLKSNFRKPTQGQVASAGASDAELEAEHQALTNILHKSLGNLTGVAPEDIQALRVRGGQLSTLAGETQGAANALSGGDAKVSSGLPIPTGLGDLAKQGLTALRGGPERVSARNLRGALRSSPIEPSQLLQPGTPSAAAPALRPVPISGGSQLAPLFDATPNTEAAGKIQSNIAGRNSLRDLTAAQNKQSAMQEFLHSNDLEQAAQDAAAGRGDRAANLRASREAARIAQEKLEGEAARTLGRENVLRNRR